MTEDFGGLHKCLLGQLDRLNNGDLKGEELLNEIKRSNAMSQIAGQIIANGNLVVSACKVANATGSDDNPLLLLTGSAGEGEQKIARGGRKPLLKRPAMGE